jgi:hypothetical protein
MELSWINKIRIGLVAALGILVIGILCWPLAAPADPMAPVRSGDVGAAGTLILVLVAFVVGAAGYFISWPHGREIGILAVPLGLCVWGIRSGPMDLLNAAANTTAKRTVLLNSLLMEPLYWLLPVAAGFAGVLAAQRLARSIRPATAETTSPKTALNAKMATTFVVAVLVSVIVSQFGMTATVRDIPPFNGVVATQPPSAQIAFGVIVAFAAAAFFVKEFLGLSYVLPAVASIFVIPVAQTMYNRGGMVDTQPASFFANGTLTVMPVQLVAFGAVGAVVGYWLAISYRYWRTHTAD